MQVEKPILFLSLVLKNIQKLNQHATGLSRYIKLVVIKQMN